MTRVRVMTYNILGGRRREPLAAVVRSIAPDVLLVNETPKLPLLWRGQCDRLCADWGMSYVAGGRRAGSNLIAASKRVRVLESSASRVAQPALKPRRGIVSAQVRLGQAQLGLVGCHLSLIPASRREEVELVLAAAARLSGPVVIAGDLNERPSGQSWTRLRSAGFRDAAAHERTFPAHRPDRRIDALLVRGDVAVVEHGAPAVDSGLLAAASDHRPVTAVLEL